jgi:DNA-binding transcriptional ArsR family regulator
MSTQAIDSIHPARGELELGAVLHALSDPVRLRIVAELARSEAEYTCGSFALPVTKSTCTHHFKVLREAGVIQQRPQGTTRLNRLRREDLEARFPGLLQTVLQAAESAAALARTPPAAPPAAAPAQTAAAPAAAEAPTAAAPAAAPAQTASAHTAVASTAGAASRAADSAADSHAAARAVA